MRNQTFEQKIAYLIGIKDYHNGLKTLTTPINDIQSIGGELTKLGFEVNCEKNIDLESFEALLERIEKTVKDETRKTQLIIYFAGHGTLNKNNEGAIALKDSNGYNEGLFEMTKLKSWICELPVIHVLLVLDCCFSGAISTGEIYEDDTVPIFDDTKLSKTQFDLYTHCKARNILTSTSHHQKAFDRIDQQNNNSPFAKYFTECLSEKADSNGDKILTLSEIIEYIEPKLSNETAGKKGLQSIQSWRIKKNEDELYDGEFIFFLPGFDYDTHIWHNGDAFQGKNPYKGLSSFENNEEDHKLFFGRDSAIKELVEKVKNHKITLVTGASGTGKSSLVQAGLTKETKNIDIKVIKPQSIFPEDGDFIIIDQWEEIITQVNEADAKFYDNIHTWIKNGKKIVGTIRSEYVYYVQIELEKRGDWNKDCIYHIPAPTPDEYAEMIEKPLRKRAGHFENNKLLTSIKQEINGQTCPLPLLSLLMSRLFEIAQERQEGEAKTNGGRAFITIKNTDYQEQGRLSGIINKIANKTLSRAQKIDSINGEKIFKTIMLRMISFTKGQIAKRKLYHHEYADFDSTNINDLVKKIIDILVTERIITKGSDQQNEFIEPAHDFLILSWAQILEWRNQLGDDQLLLFAQIIDTAHQEKRPLWDGNEDNRAEQGLKLMQAEKFVFSKKEKEFLQDSFKAKEDQKNRLISRNLISTSKLAKDRSLAFRLAEIAYHYSSPDEPSVKRQILDTYNADKGPWHQTILAHNDIITQVCLFKDAHRVISCSRDGCIKLWDLTKERPDYRLLYQNTDSKQEPNFALSPDQKTLAIALGTTCELLEIDTMKRQTFDQELPSEICKMVFSWDNSMLVFALKNQLKIWRFEQRNWLKVETPSIKNVSFAIAFSFDNQLLAIGNSQELVVWKFTDGVFVRYESNDKIYANALAFSPTQKGEPYQLAIGTNDIIHLLKLEDNQKIMSELGTHTNSVFCLQFTQDARWLISGGLDNKIKIWNISKQQEHLTLHGHTGGVKTLYYDQSRQQLATGSYDHTLKIWPLNLYEPLLAPNPTLVATSRHENLLVAAFVNTFEVRSIAEGKVLWQEQLAGEILDIALSETGKYLAIHTLKAGGAQIQLYDLELNLLMDISNKLKFPFSSFGKLSFARGGELLLFTELQASYLIEIPSGNIQKIAPNATAIRVDGNKLFDLSAGEIKIIEPLSMQTVSTYELRSEMNDYSDIIVSPDGKWMAIWWDWFSSAAYLFEINNDSLCYVKELKGQVSKVKFSQDSTKIAYINTERIEEKDKYKVEVRELKTLSILLSITLNSPIIGSSGGIGFSPDSKQLFVGVWAEKSIEILTLALDEKAAMQAVKTNKQAYVFPNPTLLEDYGIDDLLEWRENNAELLVNNELPDFVQTYLQLYLEKLKYDKIGTNDFAYAQRLHAACVEKMEKAPKNSSNDFAEKVKELGVSINKYRDCAKRNKKV